MKSRWESNINVWFPFMYSQKRNCAASLFPKQNYNVLSPDSYIHISVRDLYISRIGLSILLQPNMWTDPGNIKIAHRHMNVEIGARGRAITGKGIHKWDFHCSVDSSLTTVKMLKSRHSSQQMKGGREGTSCAWYYSSAQKAGQLVATPH